MLCDSCLFTFFKPRTDSFVVSKAKDVQTCVTLPLVCLTISLFIADNEVAGKF